MKTNNRSFKALGWFCVGLALSTCTYDVSLAQSPDEGAVPDSLDIEVQELEAGEDLLFTDTPADSIGAETGTKVQHLYRKWWVWALVTTAIAVTAVLVGGGEEDEKEEDLPGFPDPPER